MRKAKLWARLEKLKASPEFKVIAWGKIWDALREIEICTTGVRVNRTFEKSFVKRNGTREGFINSKKERKQ